MREQDKRMALQLVCLIENRANIEQPIPSNKDIGWEEIYQLLKKHDLTHLLAYALQNKGLLDKNTEIGKKLSQDMMMAIYRYESIYFEQERIKKCFKFANIPFIFLKGSVIRQYYPEPWLRTSCDIDILVPINKLLQASKVIAKNLGYRIDDKEAYDVSLFAENGVHLELHSLMEGDSVEKKLLSKVWETAYSKGDSEYFMSNDLFYFYHIAHMAKHFKNGGCGIRPFIDLIILQKVCNYNREKVDCLLQEWRLKQFELCACKLANSWLKGLKIEDLLPMEKYVLYGGVYGALDQYVAAQQNAKGNAQYLKRRIFMPYDELRKRYKILEKHKYLTPFFEVIRWISLLTPKRMQQTVKEVKKLQTLDKQKVKEIDNLFSDLGL